MAFQNLNDIRNLKLWKFFSFTRDFCSKENSEDVCAQKLYYNKTCCTLRHHLSKVEGKHNMS